MVRTISKLEEELSLLQAARLLIDDPEAWTKAASARNGDGRTTYYAGNDARSWCSVGAANAFLAGGTCVQEVVKRLSNGLPRGIVNFNDAETTRHEDVLNVFDKAIEALCQEIDGGGA